MRSCGPARSVPGFHLPTCSRLSSKKQVYLPKPQHAPSASRWSPAPSMLRWWRPGDRFEFRDAWIHAKRIGDPDPDRLSPEDWRHVDWTASTLGGLKIRVRWAGVIHLLEQAGLLRSHDPRLAALSPTGPAKQDAPVRGSGGAPPRHDWDAFWIEVALYAAQHDLDPARRRDLQQHMVEWARRELPDPPDEATIRTRLRRLFQRIVGSAPEVEWPSR